MQLDPITFEVLRNALGSMCDEGSEMIARLAYAPTISEGHDHSCALLTAEGRLVAHGNRDQAPHIGSFEPSVRVVKEWVGEFEPGDIYIFNDPYTGGIHCNDVKLIRPIHHEGRLVAFNSSTGHWPDVGGALPGSFNPKAASSPSTPAPATGPMWAARCPAASTRARWTATPRGCGCRRCGSSTTASSTAR